MKASKKPFQNALPEVLSRFSSNKAMKVSKIAFQETLPEVPLRYSTQKMIWNQRIQMKIC